MIATGSISGLGFRIRTFRKPRDGLQAEPVIAMTDEQCATADRVDGVLLESGSDFADLFELQRSGIPRLRVLGHW